MELVIKIPEEVYEKIQKRKVNQYDIDDICQSVFEGKPLPKGHGRIGDLSELETRIGNFIEHHKNLLEQTTPEALVYMNHIFDGIRYTDTIIEADKESE